MAQLELNWPFAVPVVPAPQLSPSAMNWAVQTLPGWFGPWSTPPPNISRKFPSGSNFCTRKFFRSTT